MSTQDCGETSARRRAAFAMGSPPRFLLFLLAAAGAAEAAGFTLYAGRHNQSRLLMALFLIWVLSPFVALAWASVASKRWVPGGRTALTLVTLVVTLGSLVIYARVALGPPVKQVAFAFLVVPLISWALAGVTAWRWARGTGR